MIYVCENCYYIFNVKEKCNQCPDCGKQTVRFAKDNEITEYNTDRNRFTGLHWSGFSVEEGTKLPDLEEEK